MKCPFCSKEIGDKVRFCNFCGKNISKVPELGDVLEDSNIIADDALDGVLDGKDIKADKHLNNPDLSELTESDKTYKKKTAKRQHEPKKQSKLALIIAIISVVVVIAVGVGIWAYSQGYIFKDDDEVIDQQPPNTNKIDGSIEAMKVGNYSLSVGELNYYYYAALNDFMNAMERQGASLEQIGLDMTIPLEEQECIYGGTWHDYFLGEAEYKATDVIAVFLHAQDEGYNPTIDIPTYIENNINNIRSYANNAQKEFDDFVSQNFGAGINEKIMRDIIHHLLVYNDYTNAKLKEFTPDDAELETYYYENKDNYDVVNYRSMFIDAESYGDDAEATANAMLSEITDAESFSQLAIKYAVDDKKTYYGDESDPTLFEKQAKAQISSESVADWLFDAERTPGKGVVTGDDGYYVIYFLARNRDSSPTVNVRHILIAFEPSEDGMPTDEQKGAAKTKAEEVYNQWKSGVATEDSFGELATTETADTASASSGGLYTNVSMGMMVEPFENWCFDPARVSGDSGIVETQFGYHIMYFVSEGRKVWELAAENSIIDKKMQEFLNSLIDIYPTEVNKEGIMSVGLQLPPSVG